MACFFDWDDRGLFNFNSDRSGIIAKIQGNVISEVIMAVQKGEESMMLKNALIKVGVDS